MENQDVLESEENELRKELEESFLIQQVKNTWAKHRSVGVRATWDNAKIYKSRTTRNHVFVTSDKLTNKEFKSVAVAFAALDLPMHKHSRFRTKLKKVGALDFIYNNQTYKFEVKK